MGARRRRINKELVGIAQPETADEESGGPGTSRGRKRAAASSTSATDTSSPWFIVLAWTLIGLVALFAFKAHILRL